MKKYQKENKNIIDNYTKGLDKKVSKHLKKELNQGALNSISKHNELFNTNIKASKLLNKSFFKTNDKKVNILIKVVNNDLKIANASALRMINDEYRQVIHKSTFFLANGTVSPKQAIDMATKDFLSRGLNCIEYKDGRRVNIASYSEMAVRTASLRAQLMGDGDFRKSIGRHLVIALASNAACPLCSKWENKVMIDDIYSDGTKKDGDYPLLSYAMKNGFLHPNCRDGIATYYPELEDIDNSYKNEKSGSESDETYQNDLNYINQRIKQFTRLEIGSLDEENIKKYHNQKICYEKKKEELLVKQELPYIDVTKELLDKATPNSHIVKDRQYFEYKNIKYKVDGKNVILNYSKKEKEVALWIENTFGGEIFMSPKVNKPNNISTPDYIWRKEKWDLKEIIGKSNRAVDNALKRKKGQANNFILDITKNELNEKIFIKQIEKIYHTSGREWIDKIILKKNEKVIAIYKRK